MRLASRASPLGPRDGYALLAALWLVVVFASLALSLATAARQAVAGATQRLAQVEARWSGAGCIAVANARLDQEASPTEAGDFESVVDRRLSWSEIDLTPAEYGTSCRWRLRRDGARLDVNVLDSLMIRSLAVAAGARSSQADSITAAVLDWSDPDDTRRAWGAEQSWYLARGRPGPSNRPFEHPDEILLVRGVPPEFAEWLDVETPRLRLDLAAPELISALPGLGFEGARAAARARRSRRTIDLAGLNALVGETTRKRIDLALPVLTQLVSSGEGNLWLDVEAPAQGAPLMRESLRLVQNGARFVPVERRSQAW